MLPPVSINLATLVAAVLLAWLMTASGLWGLRCVRLELDDCAGLTVACVLGAGLTGTSILATCAIVGVRPLSLLGALALLGYLARCELLQVPAQLRMAVRALVEAHPPGLVRKAAGWGIAVLATVVIAIALAPPTDWDSLAYHLDVPLEWLRHRSIHLPIDNHHVAFIGLAHVLYLPLLAVGLIPAPAVLSAVLTLVAAYACFAFGRSLFGDRVGLVAFWLFWTSTAVVLVGVTPRIDVTLALFIVSAHYVLILALTKERWEFAPAAALVLGFACGVKYLAWLYALPLIAIAAWWAVRRSGNDLGALRLGAMTGAVLVLAVAPWLMKNWLLLGAPLYPYLAERLPEPWVLALYEESSRVPSLSSGVLGMHRAIREPFTVLAWLFNPTALTPDAGFRNSNPNLLLLLAPLAALVRPKGPVLLLLVPPVAYLGMLLAYSSRLNLRYLVPAVPALTIAAAVVVVWAYGRLGRPGRVVLAIALLATGLGAALSVMRIQRESSPWRMLAGIDTQEEYLGRHWETGTFMHEAAWLNTHLSQSDTALLLYESRGLYIDVPVRQDLLHRNWAYAEPFAQPPRCLAQAGITHVLVNDGMIRYFRARGARVGGSSWWSFERYVTDCLELMHQEREFRLFRVRRNQTPTPTQ